MSFQIQWNASQRIADFLLPAHLRCFTAWSESELKHRAALLAHEEKCAAPRCATKTKHTFFLSLFLRSWTKQKAVFFVARHKSGVVFVVEDKLSRSSNKISMNVISNGMMYSLRALAALRRTLCRFPSSRFNVLNTFASWILSQQHHLSLSLPTIPCFHVRRGTFSWGRFSFLFFFYFF